MSTQEVEKLIREDDREGLLRLGEAAVTTPVGGLPPLALAARLGRLGAARALLEMGSDPFERLIGGADAPTAMSLAKEREDQDMVTLFEQAARGQEARRLAAATAIASELSQLHEIGPEHPWHQQLTTHLLRSGGETWHRLEVATSAIWHMMGEANVGASVVAKTSFEVAYGKGMKFLERERVFFRGLLARELRGREKDSAVYKLVEYLLPWYSLLCSEMPEPHDSGPLDPLHIADFFASQAGANYTLPVHEQPTRELIELEVMHLLPALEGWEAGFGKDSGRTESASDVKTVLELGGGFTLVRLMTSAAMTYEGRVMEHCVGQGSYDFLAEEGSSGVIRGIYSVRAPNGESRATIEISSGHIRQIKGRKNGPVSPDAAVPTMEAMERLGIELRDEDVVDMGYTTIPDSLIPLLKKKSVSIGRERYDFIQSIRIADKEKLNKSEARKILNTVFLNIDRVPDVETLRQLVDSGLELEKVRNKYDENIMHVAARCNACAVARYVIKNYPAGLPEGTAKRTPLRWAALGGFEDFVKIMLPLIGDEDLWLTWVDAVKAASVPVLQLLLPFVKVPRAFLDYCLKEACSFGEVELAKFAIKAGADYKSQVDQLIARSINFEKVEILKLLFLLDDYPVSKASHLKIFQDVILLGKLNMVQALVEVGAVHSPGFTEEIAFAANNNKDIVVNYLLGLSAGSSRTNYTLTSSERS